MSSPAENSAQQSICPGKGNGGNSNFGNLQVSSLGEEGVTFTAGTGASEVVVSGPCVSETFAELFDQERPWCARAGPNTSSIGRSTVRSTALVMVLFAAASNSATISSSSIVFPFTAAILSPGLMAHDGRRKLGCIKLQLGRCNLLQDSLKFQEATGDVCAWLLSTLVTLRSEQLLWESRLTSMPRRDTLPPSELPFEHIRL